MKCKQKPISTVRMDAYKSDMKVCKKKKKEEEELQTMHAFELHKICNNNNKKACAPQTIDHTD